MKRILKRVLMGAKRWLTEEPATPEKPVSFDNSYAWIGQAFSQILRDPVGGRYRPYVWSVLQGAALAKVLSHSRVSVFEFGVAGGSGLVSLERVAGLVEQKTGVGIDVYGFDTGKGLPRPQDYRDLPYMWEEGDFSMDEAALRARLKRAQLKLGLIEDTVPEFLRTSFAPVAFISIDVDLYSATKQALTLLDADQGKLLPRVFCYFDNIMGYGYNDFTGERLAIHEFNAEHTMRKLSPIYGLKWFVPQEFSHDRWIDMLQIAHFFDHPSYGQLDHLRRRPVLDINGNWHWQT
ncbi:MAG: hypothetical protein OJF52_003328 [Nitrospira sp.]|jgi:hypothetical protein|nr:MAG: hypothetical protein OJF52_003328 [Nitrospira sp.]